MKKKIYNIDFAIATFILSILIRTTITFVNGSHNNLDFKSIIHFFLLLFISFIAHCAIIFIGGLIPYFIFKIIFNIDLLKFIADEEKNTPIQSVTTVIVAIYIGWILQQIIFMDPKIDYHYFTFIGIQRLLN